MKKIEKCHLDEMIHCSIHEHEFKQLTKKQQALFEEYRNIEMYQDGLKRGEPFDKVEEAKRLIKDYNKEIKKNKGKESNTECMIVGQLLELLGRMMAYEIRKLDLGKILDE